MSWLTGKTREVLPGIAFALLLHVVMLAPFPSGSVEAHWVAGWCIVIGIGSATVAFQAVRPSDVRSLAPTLLVLLLLAAVLLLQMSPGSLMLPADPLWRETAQLIDAILLPAPVAVSRGAPFFSAGSTLLFSATFLVSFAICLDVQRAKLLLSAIAISGGVQALYSVATLASDPVAHETLTGWFVNRNTAATYFGSCAVISLAIFISVVRSRDRMAQAWVPFSPPSRQAILAGVLFLATLSATLLTQSRTGTLVTLSVLAWIAWFLWRRAGGVGSRPVLVGSAVLLSVIVIAEFLGQRIGMRIAQTGFWDAYRWAAYRAEVAALLDHPWTGTGIGTFPDIFPAYRPATIASPLVWDRAHSSLLELAVETGLPFTAAVMALWLFVFMQLARGCRARRRGLVFPAVGMGVFILGSLHSAVDFSLQIPGYSVLFAAVVGCGLAQSKPAREHGPVLGAPAPADAENLGVGRDAGGSEAGRSGRDVVSRGSGRATWIFRVAMIALGIICVSWALGAGPATVRAAALTALADRLLSGSRIGPDALRAELKRTSEGACLPSPGNESLAVIAFANAREAFRSAIFVEDQLTELERQAITALSCAPYRPLPWYLLFWTRSVQSGVGTTNAALLRMSYRLGSNEGWLSAIRNPFAVGVVQALPADLRSVVLNEFGALLRDGLFLAAVQALANAPDGVREGMLYQVEMLPVGRQQQFQEVLRRHMPVSAEPADALSAEWQEYLKGLDQLRSLAQDPGEGP